MSSETVSTGRRRSPLRSARPPGEPKISELDFRRQIVGSRGLAEIFGWEHVGFRAAMTSQGWRTPGTGTMAKGWPDLVLVRARDRRLIFAELKAEAGRLSDEQYRVLDLLRTLVFDGYVPYDPLLREPFSTRQLDSIGSAVPRIEVFVWRPSDLEAIAEILR